MRNMEILEINEQAATISGCIRFDKGSAKFPFPEAFLPVIDEVKKDITGKYFGYPAIGGERALKEQIANFERKSGRDVSADDIVVTHGGMSGIFTVLGIATQPGDEVITNEYFFEGFSVAFDYFKLSHKKVNLLDAHALKNAITKNTRVIVINSPENPTGKVYTLEEINVIAAIAKKHDIFLLSDEVTNKIIYGDTRWVASPLEQGKVVAINSFSKNWFIPGIRVGWNISKNHEINMQMARFLSAQSVGVNSFGQLLMAKALATIDYPVFMKPYMKILSSRREVLKRALDEKGIGYLQNAQGGMNFYVDVKGDSRKAASRLLNEFGIAVIPGDLFEGSPSRYIRVGFGAVNEREIDRGISGISRVI
ncbi:MAG: pyridoxal phosphate-dependent aminotransferase [Candidatus Liptonbacteria bacterium]|nr:pyridoxal phosphate-dependent aminotransferase [Candidatus Liptonbacteria bacterium]